ncbi:unnamed protein product [Choristocarpus tenellus]
MKKDVEGARSVVVVEGTIPNSSPATAITSSTQASDSLGKINPENEGRLREPIDAGDMGALYKTLDAVGCLPPPPCEQREGDNDTDSDMVIDVENGAPETGAGDGCPFATTSSNFHLVKKAASSVQVPPNLILEAWRVLKEWRAKLGPSDLADVYNTADKKWYLAKILEAFSSDSASTATQSGIGIGDEIRIHYQGWPSKYDENIRRDSHFLQPPNAHTKPRKKPQKKSRKPQERQSSATAPARVLFFFAPSLSSLDHQTSFPPKAPMRSCLFC